MLVAISASIKRVELKLEGFVSHLSMETTQKLSHTANCNSALRNGLDCMLLHGDMLLSEQAVLDATMLPNNYL